MGNHSLYSVQAIAIIVSPANHLGQSDLYFTSVLDVGEASPSFSSVADSRSPLPSTYQHARDRHSNRSSP